MAEKCSLRIDPFKSVDCVIVGKVYSVVSRLISILQNEYSKFWSQREKECIIAVVVHFNLVSREIRR